jgi:DNA-binding MarR family transcriptional regulator
MSISKLRRQRNGRAAPEAEAAYSLPATVSRPALLEGSSDRRFRTLVADLQTIAARMEMVREHFGRRLGITGPQYSLIVGVAHMQGSIGVGVSALARSLHVSSAFVASESGKLARRGLLYKRTNPRDRRGVLLSIAPAGRLKVDRVSAEIRAVNDLFFGVLDQSTFAALGAAAAKLVEGSAAAIRHVAAGKAAPRAGLRRA